MNLLLDSSTPLSACSRRTGSAMTFNNQVYNYDIILIIIFIQIQNKFIVLEQSANQSISIFIWIFLDRFILRIFTITSPGSHKDKCCSGEELL